MSRPYGAQPSHPPRQYQPSPGPPQPQWQAPQRPSAPGWSDTQQQPPPPAAHHAYNPTFYPPAPGTAYSPISPPQQNASETASWGVRYNQKQQFTQHQHSTPPLPPRPPSGAGYGPSTGPLSQPPGAWSQAPGISSYAQTTQWQSDPHNHQQAQPVPPPPPPRPPEYLSLPHDSQGWPHPQYSHNPPSHYYEPSNQHPYQSGMTNDQYIQQVGSAPDSNATVSPIEPPATYWRPPLPQTLPPDARHQSHNEARAQTPKPTFGGPSSDWEHFEPIADHAEDTNLLGSLTKFPQTTGQEAQLPERLAESSHAPSETYAAQAQRQPQPDERSPEHRSSVSSAAVASPVAPQVGPAPLGMSRSHRDSTDSRASPVHLRESPSATVAVPQRTGTIDSVIQAWNRPLDGRSSWHADRPGSSRASSSQSSISAFSTARPEGELAEIPRQSPKQIHKSKPRLPPSNANLDPYADLEPEYRASLSRYVAMLRKESEATSDTGKFNIFKAFVDKELRLRSVLYGLDEVGTEPANAANGNTAQHSSSTESEDLQNVRPLERTATPKIPTPIPFMKSDGSRTSTPENKPRAQFPKLAVSTSPNTNDDSFVIVNQPSDELEYSPGGRPKVLKLPAVPKTPQHPAPDRGAVTSAPVTGSFNAVASPSDNAPMALNDYSTGGPQSPGRNAPIVLDVQEEPPIRPGSAPLNSKAAHAAPLKFEPPRPVYTPFRYAEASRADLDKLIPHQPAYQAYTAMRQSADSGRILGQAPTTIGSASIKGQDSFLGLIRSQSRAHPTNRPATPSGLLVKDPRTEASLAIRALVPKAIPAESKPPKLAAIEKEMESILDEFGFIREAVSHWDRDNRQLRVRQERERQSRQEESDRHIDALYEENEIGYPDISTMEADFKLTEAKRRYEEDQQELESFTTQVFEPITERLQTEIFQLNSQYICAVDILDLKSEAASRFMNSGEDLVRSSQAMGVVISLFNKLQIRYQKSAEAHFERERRRKTLELTVLRANGDAAAMKNLEQKFRMAERLQVLHEAQEADTRANKLVDTFDRVTARALGDNQTYIDDLSAKLRRLDAALAGDGKELTPNTFEPEDLRDILLQTRAALNFVAADSNAILQASNTADTMLNSADYAVSVAKAQMANSPAAAYERLKEEKEKEDVKIGEDLQARRESLSSGPAEGLSLIESITTRMGREPDHDERIQKALAAAKLRNATKES